MCDYNVANGSDNYFHHSSQMNENDDAKHGSDIFEIKNDQQEPILCAGFNIEVRKMLLFSKIRHILPVMILLLSLPFFVTSRLTAKDWMFCVQ